MTPSIKTFCLKMIQQADALLKWIRCLVLHLIAYLSDYKFTSRIQLFTDETQPVRRDQFFRVQMAGRILTPRDHVEIVVKVTILDVTSGESKPQQVFCADEEYRSEETSEFEWIEDYGIVEKKNTLLDHWVTVVQFPCHILRLAYRGRRKLLFSVQVLEKETVQELVVSQKTAEYVYCSDGYREVHSRRLDVLGSCLYLAAMSVNHETLPDEIKGLMKEWILHKADIFISEEDLLDTLTVLEANSGSLTLEKACEAILAFGEDAERFNALELALQVAAMSPVVTRDNLNQLYQIAEGLQIQQARFLKIAQKVLLSANCSIEDPSQLLGISSEMDADAFRKRLNEEYRKWNARVTHPDPQVRTQTDQILTLIAEIRSRFLQSCS